ncbi:hypothetical protein MAIT1_03763 [Magnetofaba australis IT-1]|uniref:Uncharacterized protein n=2 Tax=Magnetofaba TaxID=1472292 RepID=A0A1Y2K434_9PROT|nr:hypothetical protein MAIT1_03763 [Magnetofaba australis IT-1]
MSTPTHAQGRAAGPQTSAAYALAVSQVANSARVRFINDFTTSFMQTLESGLAQQNQSIPQTKRDAIERDIRRGITEAVDANMRPLRAIAADLVRSEIPPQILRGLDQLPITQRQAAIRSLSFEETEQNMQRLSAWGEQVMRNGGNVRVRMVMQKHLPSLFPPSR